MPKRIVDESFVNTLEETGQHSLQSRFDRLKELQNKISAEDVFTISGKTPSWLGKILFRLIKPALEPYFIQQLEYQRELNDLLHASLEEISNRIDHLSVNLRDVYIKSGEAIAALNRDIANDFEKRIEKSALTAGEIAKQVVADETAVQMEHLRLDSMKKYQDLVTRSDLLINHMEAELEALQRDLNKHIGSTAKRVELCLSQLDNAANSIHTMKQKVAVISNDVGLRGGNGQDGSKHEASADEHAYDNLYYDHQQTFRSSGKKELEKFDLYLEYFRSAESPVVDLGCGNGEFLKYLEDNGIDALGVELSETMVESCEAKGLTVVKSDVLEWLSRQKETSYKAVFCSHMLEHMEAGEIQHVIHEIHRLLVDGGMCIVETINPESIYALTHAYFLDPTHKTPIPWKLMQFYFEATGFRETEVRLLSEAAEREKLQAVDLESAVPATIESSFIRLNRDIEKLNDFLFGHYDYAVVARK